VRKILIVALIAALMAVACASPSGDDTDSGVGGDAPVTTSPVTTSPVTISPVTTSPVAGGASVPSGDGDVTLTTLPQKEGTVKPIEPVEGTGADRIPAVVADLAARLGVDESSITVVSIEEVTWPDGSLGCPQPGMMYTQALVNGSLIVLDVDGTTHEYHSGADGRPFYCQDPTPPTTGGYGDV